jgi:hypothetical protein
MDWIRWDIEERIPLSILIMNSKFSSGFDRTRKEAHNLRKQKSKMVAQINFEFQSLGAG